MAPSRSRRASPAASAGRKPDTAYFRTADAPLHSRCLASLCAPAFGRFGVAASANPRTEIAGVDDSATIRCLIGVMSSRRPDPQIIELDRAEIAVVPWRWEFAHARRAEIDRHFAARRREQPALWNGRVLLLNHYAIEQGVLRGTSFETDYANFLAWREWDCCDGGVFNVFSAAALRSADGAYLVGRMAPSTSIA